MTVDEFLEVQEYRLLSREDGLHVLRKAKSFVGCGLVLILAAIPLLIWFGMSLVALFHEWTSWPWFFFASFTLTGWIYLFKLAQNRSWQLVFKLLDDGISIPGEGIYDAGGIQGFFVKSKVTIGYASPFETGHISYRRTLCFTWQDEEVELMEFYSRQEEVEPEIEVFAQMLQVRLGLDRSKD